MQNNDILHTERTVCIKRWYLLAVTLTAVIAPLGCMSAYNAHSVDAPDGRHSVYCHIRGAGGRSYLAESYKKIFIEIYAVAPDAKERAERAKQEAVANLWRSDYNPSTNFPVDTLLFRSVYRIKASALEWTAQWGDHDALSILFYDYGPGVEGPVSAKTEGQFPKRFLRTLVYRFDATSNTYIEEPVK